MKSRGRTILVVTILSAALVAGSIYFIKRTPFEERRPRVGDAAPEIQLAGLSGRMVSLADYRGGVVLVNFWASWCPPCKSELEWFEKVFEDYEDDGFAVVAVSLDEVSPELVMDLGIAFPVVVANDRVKEAYGGVSDVPVSFLVGRDGRVVKKVWKVYPEKTLRADVEAALGVSAGR
jgi:cytochrome c biogenesis protein CcmG/thiol:disulfide interchange protein DsbE